MCDGCAHGRSDFHIFHEGIDPDLCSCPFGESGECCYTPCHDDTAAGFARRRGEDRCRVYCDERCRGCWYQIVPPPEKKRRRLMEEDERQAAVMADYLAGARVEELKQLE
jgi:hypothetical protein